MRRQRSDSRKSGALADLYARNSWRAIATIAAEYALIAISVTIGQALEGVWTYLVIVLLVGTRQYALGECMAHEASHRNLSSDALAQRRAGHCGVLAIFRDAWRLPQVS